MTQYRWAERRDLPELLNLIEEGFAWQGAKTDWRVGHEHRILFDYLYTRSEGRVDLVWLGVEKGRLVTAVGFFPQQLNLDRAQIAFWAISPVVTRIDCRGRGLAAQCLTQALKAVKSYGVTAVFLWGIPDFYPRFGFVPVLARYKTKLTAAQFKKRDSNSNGVLRTVEVEDLPQLATIYNARQSELWLQPIRSMQWWQNRLAECDCELAEYREVPYPKKENWLVWDKGGEQTNGYLYFVEEPIKKQITITESAAASFEDAVAMVSLFVQQYLAVDYTLWIRGTPQHYLNMAAYRLGGTHVNPAPLAGMIKIINWSGFIALLNYENRNLGLMQDKHQGEIPFQDEMKLQKLTFGAEGWEITTASPGCDSVLNGSQLTRLLFGIYDQDELQLLNHVKEVPEIFFPVRYPFVWDVNYLY